MPSPLHEMLVELFRSRPELAPELLRDALGLQLPQYCGVRIESADLPDVRPAPYRSDLVVSLVLQDNVPVHGIIVEMQLRPFGDSADHRVKRRHALRNSRCCQRLPTGARDAGQEAIKQLDEERRKHSHGRKRRSAALSGP